MSFGSVTMQFSRNSRLFRPVQFKRVFKQAVRSHDDCFRILARPNQVQRHRLGMAVSKKACSKAVGRNRIKRIVRESFRAQLAGQTAEPALDFVVLPTAQATDQSNSVLGESLETHWQKLIKKAAGFNFIQPGKSN